MMYICCLVGCVLGAIPGLSGGLGITLILPMTFALSKELSFSMLVGMYVGGVSGSFIAAVLVGIPGSAASIGTCYDGYAVGTEGLGRFVDYRKRKRCLVVKKHSLYSVTLQRLHKFGRIVCHRTYNGFVRPATLGSITNDGQHLAAGHAFGGLHISALGERVFGPAVAYIYEQTTAHSLLCCPAA